MEREIYCSFLNCFVYQKAKCPDYNLQFISVHLTYGTYFCFFYWTVINGYEITLWREKPVLVSGYSWNHLVLFHILHISVPIQLPLRKHLYYSWLESKDCGGMTNLDFWGTRLWNAWQRGMVYVRYAWFVRENWRTLSSGSDIHQ